MRMVHARLLRRFPPQQYDTSAALAAVDTMEARLTEQFNALALAESLWVELRDNAVQCSTNLKTALSG